MGFDEYDLVVVGTCYTDLIYRDIPHLPAPGEEVFCGGFQWAFGGVYITAVAASRLGLRVGLIAPLGRGVLPQVMRQQLMREGVDTKLLYEAQADLDFVTVAMNHAGDRGFLTYDDPREQDEFHTHLERVMGQVRSRWVHLSSRLASDAIFEHGQRTHSQISLNVGWNESWLHDRELRHRIVRADLFILNCSEALAITGVASASQALAILMRDANRVIITLGEDGCLAQERGQSPIRYRGVPAPVLDTTGAGDNFAAGLIAALRAGKSLRDALILADFCASQSVQAMGGSTASPSRLMANQFLTNQSWQLPNYAG